MQTWWQVIWVFVTAYLLSGMCGILRYLATTKKRKLSEALIAGGYSACVGLGISLMFNKKFDDPALLLGTCVFSGLSGITGIDQLLVLIRAIKKQDSADGATGI